MKNEKCIGNRFYMVLSTKKEKESPKTPKEKNKTSRERRTRERTKEKCEKADEKLPGLGSGLIESVSNLGRQLHSGVSHQHILHSSIPANRLSSI